MQRFLCTSLTLSLFLCWAVVAIASEQNELRERADALQKKAAVLAEQGQPDAAEQLLAEAAKLLAAAKDQAKGRIAEYEEEFERQAADQLLQYLAALEQAGQAKKGGNSEEVLAHMLKLIADSQAELKHNQAMRKKGYLQIKKQPLGDQPVKIHKLDDVGKRIKHYRAAAENLRAAGAHDLAEELAKKADALEQEARQAKEAAPTKLAKYIVAEKGAANEIGAQLEEIRREMKQLRAEVEELRGQLRKQ